MEVEDRALVAVALLKHGNARVIAGALDGKRH
jgi:hypothetical protein